VYVVGRLGAHDFSYYEVHYFGRPGGYEEFGFGLNQAGYLPNGSSLCFSVLRNTPPLHSATLTYPADLVALAELESWRTRVIFNTFAVSAPGRQLKDYFATNLGVDYNRVRTVTGQG
jgi:hypothetical protein